jgi:hypothetical protein
MAPIAPRAGPVETVEAAQADSSSGVGLKL